MSWLFRHNWLWEALAFLLGAVITWILLIRRDPRISAPAPATVTGTTPATGTTAAATTTAATGTTARVGTTPAARTAPEPARPKPEPPAAKVDPPAPKVEAPAPKAESPASNGEAATLFDVPAKEEEASVDVQPEPAKAEVGPYGAGSIAAPVDGSVPDGYTVKGNAQSMLFHTTDSPYYGRTKPEVWFRTEADAAAAGFTKYERRRKK